MRAFSIRILALLFAFSAVVATSVSAQTPPPLAGVPRPQSIDVVTARRVLAAAIVRAAEAKVLVSVAVVDANGDLVAFERMDGAVAPSVLISQGKAHAALLFGMSTAD